ncbi:hypothetical protein CMO92_02620 [Candidatus Woesearchaeota archaeon]|nr:hypothetical protein [Candidatus Woesearchaeota archaeon]|tara:strand:+ start:149 stop:1117 length:969 start_codon:yes stop_codon:yes gene_type:complete
MTEWMLDDKRMLFVLNPHAGKNGTWRRADEQRLLRLAEDVTILKTSRATRTREAIIGIDDLDLIGVYGGEGTVGNVTRAIVEKGVDMPLGYLGGGSFHGAWSKVTGVTNFEQGMKALQAGKKRGVDLFEIETDTGETRIGFMAGFRIDGIISRNRYLLRKRGINERKRAVIKEVLGYESAHVLLKGTDVNVLRGDRSGIEERRGEGRTIADLSEKMLEVDSMIVSSFPYMKMRGKECVEGSCLYATLFSAMERPQRLTAISFKEGLPSRRFPSYQIVAKRLEVTSLAMDRPLPIMVNGTWFDTEAKSYSITLLSEAVDAVVK